MERPKLLSNTSETIQLDVYLKSKRKPVSLLLSNKEEAKQFYAMLNNKENDFVVFHQIAFSKAEFNYAFYFEVK